MLQLTVQGEYSKLAFVGVINETIINKKALTQGKIFKETHHTKPNTVK
jgi:hypothetical protein